MKDFMEKIKANKKMVAIAGILILAIIIVAIIASQVGGSYKKTIKNFAKAMSDESKMEKFVDKNVNLRAIYAMGKVENQDNASEEFKNAYKNSVRAALHGRCFYNPTFYRNNRANTYPCTFRFSCQGGKAYSAFLQSCL